MASRKYQEVVVNGNAASDSSRPRAPAFGGVTYEVCSALACHVIGPLEPATWKLTASLRPSNAAFDDCKTGRSTASLKRDAPGASVTAGFPPNITGRFVPATTFP